MAGEAEGRERGFQHVQRAAVGRRDALAADQRAGERQRVGEGLLAGEGPSAVTGGPPEAQLRSSSLIEVLARVPASTRLTITAQ